MAITHEQIDALPDYDATRMLKMVNAAIMSLLGGGQSYTIDQNTYTKADLEKLKAFRRELMTEAAIDADETGSSIALARFGDQQ